MLELTISFVVDVLPIIIDNQAGHLDVMLSQGIDGFDNFLVRQSLPESIPGALG